MAKNVASILIVEDDPTLNEAYRTLFVQAGYRVEVARNGQEALGIVNKTEPDLIFLDLRMPVMNGIEFLRSYDKSKRHKVKIIVFSNYDMQKEIDEAYTLGADRYVLKAWASPKELLRIVETTLHKRS